MLAQLLLGGRHVGTQHLLLAGEERALGSGSCLGVVGYKISGMQLAVDALGIAVVAVGATHHGVAIGGGHEMEKLVAMHEQGDGGAVGLNHVDGLLPTWACPRLEGRQGQHEKNQHIAVRTVILRHVGYHRFCLLHGEALVMGR